MQYEAKNKVWSIEIPQFKSATSLTSVRKILSVDRHLERTVEKVRNITCLATSGLGLLKD